MSESLVTLKLVVFPKDSPPEIRNIQVRSSLATVPVNISLISFVQQRTINFKLSGRGHKTGWFFYVEQ